MPAIARMFIIALLGSLAPAYFAYREVWPVYHQVADLRADLGRKNADFYEAARKKEEIGKLEAQLDASGNEVAKMTAKLPSDYFIDEVLMSAAELSKELQLNIEKFDPVGEGEDHEVLKFSELVVNMSVSGPFAKVATFYDRLLHLDKLMRIKSACSHT